MVEDDVKNDFSRVVEPGDGFPTSRQPPGARRGSGVIIAIGL
jgi:hypothetical protein